MNLHEYQAKKIFANYGLPVPKGVVAHTIQEVVSARKLLGSNSCVLKAQIHAGGRGKAGGVQLAYDTDQLKLAAKKLLHKHLVTYQTDENGQLVSSLLIEEALNIQSELYLGAVIDRATRCIVIIASTEGGVDIEKIAREAPSKILKVMVDPCLGVMYYQARDLAFRLGLQGQQIKQFTTILRSLGKMFREKDLALLEINPLIITDKGNLVCLDGKITIDENALYRQPSIAAMRDVTQEDKREIQAKEWDLNYISLNGNIGCMVNGAGLAMATMDLIKLHGGNPANFLDVGGGATKERVTEAFKIILSDARVTGVLVNIFGGIVRCDIIASGIIAAVSEVGVKIPVVVRLEGNKAVDACSLLNNSGLNIISAQSLQGAVEQIIQAAGGKV